MNIWLAFFLVLSVVVLAAPLLFQSSGLRRGGPRRPGDADHSDDVTDEELELDLAMGRLTREDYETMSRREPIIDGRPDGGSRDDNGYLSES